jgi:hypothetical protein
MNRLPYCCIIIAVVLLSNCKNESEIVSLTPDIVIRLPENYKITKNDSIAQCKTFEANISDDRIMVSKNLFREFDTLNLEGKRKLLSRNVNLMIRSCDFNRVDSTYSLRGEILQCDLRFDGESHKKPFTFYGRFLVQNNILLVISYQTNNPGERESIENKDKLFSSIKIK